MARRSGESVSVVDVMRPWSADYRRSKVLLVDAGQVQGWLDLEGVEPTPSAVASSFPSTQPRLRPLEPRSVSSSRPGVREPITVVICTRERADALRMCLARVAEALHADAEAVQEGVDRPPSDVLVVDNAPVTDATAEVVADAARAGLAVRRVVAPAPGLSRARNVGLREAMGDVVAFTDDDVLVDRHWLVALRSGFARNERVAVVTGMVPSAEMETPVQALFDQQLRWSSQLEPEWFDLTQRHRRPPSFPYAAGQFGTGASMAMRRQLALDVGGFDEALGAGTPARGGEDLEMFVRVLRAGCGIAYEPSAIAWHVHRRDDDAFRKQVFGYGSGLTAYVTKLLLSADSGDVVRRAAVAAAQLGASRRSELAGRQAAGARGMEARGMLWGPPAYLMERYRSRSVGRSFLGRFPSSRPPSTRTLSPTGSADPPVP